MMHAGRGGKAGFCGENGNEGEDAIMASDG